MQRLFLRGLALLLALVPTGGALAETRLVSGALIYPERVALPDTAELALELRDAGGMLLSLTRQPTDGAQVPLRFDLEVPAGIALSLQAAVFDDGRPLRKTDPVAVPAGDGDADLGEIRLARHTAMGFASRLRCGADEVELGFVGGIARLRLGGRVIDMAPEPAASGGRFGLDAETWVWTRANTALVSVEGEMLSECLPADAVPALPFRALGHEPSWLLTLDGENLRLLLDFGARELVVPAPAPRLTPAGVVYEGGAIAATLTPGLCRDSATGMPHPFAVTVTAEGRTLTGCGGDPEAVLAGTWRLETLEGDTLEGRPVELAFDGGRLGVAAPCNRATGGYEITGEGLVTGPLASTRMMCPAPAMAAEERLLTHLAQVHRFDIDAAGRLLLIAGADRVLVARR